MYKSNYTIKNAKNQFLKSLALFIYSIIVFLFLAYFSALLFFYGKYVIIWVVCAGLVIASIAQVVFYYNDMLKKWRAI